MSRQSIAPSQRNLTLTEELEKLEQSITLTLQEIDHNFSRAHRIVTSSILPIVEEYATHSAAVWEGSKFWKQFFEASANVSLSSYEEHPGGADDDEGEDPTTTETEASSGITPSSSSYASPSQHDATTTPERQPPDEEEASSLSTPKPKAKGPKPPTFTSPYESLKRTLATEDPSTSTLPSTPRAQTAASHEDTSSPLAPPPSTAQRANARTPANDVLLHRVLDRNYRLQATPHTQPRLPKPGTARKGATPRKAGARDDDDNADEEMDSSPFVEAPDLNAEIFDSPVRRPRVPGVSVLTPARGKGTEAQRNVVTGTKGKEKDVWDSDSDEGDGFGEGISPPKTMQFHIPRERLLRTPAKEASKRIVEDLLLTAGGSVTDDLDEDSPSVVRRTDALDADTF